jgi:hypothetical protein
MYLLFETPAGYALFKAKDSKLAAVENIFESFSSPERAAEVCVSSPRRAALGGLPRPAAPCPHWRSPWRAFPASPPPRPLTPRARLLSTLFSPWYDYASGDAWNAYTRTEPLLDRFRRDLLFVKPGCVVIFDEVVTRNGTPRELEWRLHTRATATIAAGCLLVRGQQASLRGTVLLPETPDLTLAETPAPNPKHRTPYVVLKPHGKVAAANFLVVLEPLRDLASPAATIKAVPAHGGCGVRVTDRGSTAVALFATGPTATAADLSLHGAAAWTRTVAGRLEAFALHRGTRLALGEQTLVEASAPLDVTVLFGDAATLAHANAATPVTLTLAVGARRHLTLDGQTATAARMTADQASVHLSPGVHTLQCR